MLITDEEKYLQTIPKDKIVVIKSFTSAVVQIIGEIVFHRSKGESCL